MGSATITCLGCASLKPARAKIATYQELTFRTSLRRTCSLNYAPQSLSSRQTEHPRVQSGTAANDI